MKKNKRFFIAVILIIAGAGGVYFYKSKIAPQAEPAMQEVVPEIGDIRLTISTTGVVEPQNRLEIKPSINGRIEEILVSEGDEVIKGQILAWMSSTERAALVDAALSQPESARQYWEDVYKKTPVISPMSGRVIVRGFEPGQTITTSDALLVLSDRLIVTAQFDETDIGRVRVGQPALITLDAYPEYRIDGTVERIAYESELVNNVTIYNVDIVPQSVPEFFRSGMSADVEVVEQEKKGVLLIPADAIQDEGGRTTVMVRGGNGGPERRTVTVGMDDGMRAEIISGLSADDRVLMNAPRYEPLKRQQIGNSPFMPSPRKSNDSNK